MTAVPSHLVLVPLFEGVDALDVTGPAEVFTMANLLLAPEQARYEVRTVGVRPGAVRAFSGIRLLPDTTVDEVHERPDTLLVPGRMDIVDGYPRPFVDQDVVAWLRLVGGRAGRIAAVCAGSHLAAEAGLLDGHRATTHWATVEQLAAAHPTVEVESDPIFVRSGRVWTSAGITASMDLALALVAEDHGDPQALRIAQLMVMYLQRPGGQSQFSAPLAFAPSSRADMADLRRWIVEHLDADLSVTALAGRLAVSPRHLARLFRAETGTTPGDYVEALRVEHARRLLERTSLSSRAVAGASGLGSVETLHRVFQSRLGTTPGEYRKRFTTAR
ncbi:GlxA family transcriptional regulator [Pseudonocardia spinosispora]|uniref:GlxA family transcriptional regulator n=1 Tax=Pseudonocardia spinosispora TaxID=103441 RepID=UPI00056BA3D1|nr:DJ-1/PfpI family protein [Pseudonocardia spinosispora]